MLSIFYKCRGYSEEMKSIPSAVLNDNCKSSKSDDDVVKYIVKGLDSHYLKACSDKVKRDLEKSKAKVKQ